MHYVILVFDFVPSLPKSLGFHRTNETFTLAARGVEKDLVVQCYDMILFLAKGNSHSMLNFMV